jgi:aspartyl protease family protein
MARGPWESEGEPPQRGLRTGLRNAAIWAAICVALLGVYAFRDEATYVAQRVYAELDPTGGVAEGPRSISFRAARDGHFHVDAAVNGQRLRFLVDTGATRVSLSRGDAERIGIDTSKLVYNQRVQTANGIARAAGTTLREVRIGPITVTNVLASVSERRDDGSLLGLSFLSRLESYAVNGNTLTLTGRP